ncbi:UbiA family prenyltransferase [Marisediminicola senii]|uniref:UbiA family prenyltransferase n=1 Tax=Marisediminicola senii TaxID=2711233 RepID=UPI0013E9FEF3|nr:UbiA family prenyltransferase [Marisediminicola senii]
MSEFDRRETPRRDAMRALLGSTHPGPTVTVTIVAVVLGIGIGLEPWRLLLLGLAVIANQASVGLSNDWIDADRDREAGRQDKPVAAGLIEASTVRTAAFSSAALSIVLTIPLGWWAALAHAVFIASAWSYNAGLKSTVFSVVPYVVSFGLLPTIVTLSMPQPAVAAWWAMVMGALLGVAAHLANVLPDFDDDRATGVIGLPHRIGAKLTGILTWVVLAAASIVAFAGPSGQPAEAQSIGLIATIGIAIAGVWLSWSRKPSRLLFRLIMVSALLNVALLATSGERLVG